MHFFPILEHCESLQFFEIFVIIFEISGTCIEQFTRGQCPDGQLVVEDRNRQLKCDCGPHMKSYYWIPDGKCYPHYQQGLKIYVFIYFFRKTKILQLKNTVGHKI